MKTTFWDVIAGLICIGAGIYLLQTQASESSILEVLMHGIGVYFIGKGLFVIRAGMLAAKQVRSLESLVEIGALDHQRRTAA
jgi:hypothetical protein